MILYPAIDMRHGAVVRLHQGDFAQTTVYAEDPVAQAQACTELGFSWLHLADLAVDPAADLLADPDGGWVVGRHYHTLLDAPVAGGDQS